jgi:hypothetical protein
MLLREYRVTDLDTIENINFFAAASIRYHGDINAENVLCVANAKEEVIAVGYLKYDESFASLGEQMIEVSMYSDETCQVDAMIDDMLLEGLINRFNEIKEANPKKKLNLRVFREADEIKDMQFFLVKRLWFNFCHSCIKI